MDSLATYTAYWLLGMAKEAAFHVPPLRRFFFYRYRYMFSPRQLCFFIDCLDQTRHLPGAVVEMGCAAGHSTVWMNRHMDEAGIDKPYVCIDTFAGFTAADTAYEVRHRSKDRQLLALSGLGLSVNKKKWFDATLRDNHVTRVRSFQADVAAFDLAAVAPAVAFCLIDVDLYLPVKAALARVYPLMDPGGLIVIDDCKPDNVFDGARQAYHEFTAAHGLPVEIVHEKLGVIRKPTG